MKKDRRRQVTLLLCLCLCLSLVVLSPARASADATVIGKVLTTTSYTPVALMSLDYVTAATSTGGVYLADYRWIDTALGTTVTDAFSTGSYEVNITLGTYDGFVFADQVSAYLNNSPADCTISADHRFLTLWRTYSAEIWAPSVIKNPSGETVDEGGTASFSATALYTLGYEWHAVDPADHKDYLVTDLPDLNGVILDNPNRSTLNLHEVPASMDGWSIYCTFLGASWAKKNSAAATLKVRHAAPTPSPTPEPTQEPTPSQTPEPTPEPALPETPPPAAEPVPTPELHSHSFSADWSFDGERHWHACACGERADEAAHEMRWQTEKHPTKDEPGIERGVCTVCGYETSRETEFTTLGRALSYAPFGLGALAVLALLAAVLRRRKKAPPKSGGYSGRHVK